jgi:hypothetical protein
MKSFLTLLIITCISVAARAQAIQRSTLSSFGQSSIAENIYLSQTAGQGSVHVQTAKSGVVLNQGFQQAFTLSGANQHQKTVYLHVYPNPTTGNFSVAVDLGRAIEYDFTIYDAVGQSLYRKEGLTGHINEISLAGDVSPGTYTIRLTTKDGLTGVSKLVIQ